MPFYTILGITIHNLTLQNVLENILLCLKNQTTTPDSNNSAISARSELLSVVTVNPEFIMRAGRDPRFKKALNSAYIAVPDGSGVLLAGLLKRTIFKQRITGVRLVRELTVLAAEHDLTIGYIGGRHESAHTVLRATQIKFPHISAWAHQGPELETTIYSHTSNSATRMLFTPQSMININKFLSDTPQINSSIKPAQSLSNYLDLIRTSHILIVAFGAPKQEFFMKYLAHELAHGTHNVAAHPIVAVGAGGTLDEIAGIVPSCPDWIEKAGMKWLFRLIVEPRRYKRQLDLLRFIAARPWRN